MIEFSLQFGPEQGDGQFSISVHSQHGEASGYFRCPINAEEMPKILERIEHSSRFSITEQSADHPRHLGAVLFKELFSEQRILSLYRSCCNVQQGCIRLVLQMDPEQKGFGLLHRLPWEFLYDNDRGTFLTLQEISVVRHIVAPAKMAPPPPDHLNVLVVTASPTDFAPLEVKEECQLIQAALCDNTKVQMEVLEKASYSDLMICLRKKEFHILHFIGHGTFHAESGTGVLVFEREGRSELVAASDLVQMGRELNGLRLVFLNACKTGQMSESSNFFRSAFDSVAGSLIRSGIPAVIAMRYPIEDRQAVKLAQAFYEKIGLGGTLDEALREGRHAMRSLALNSMAWGTITLFSRNSSCKMFGEDPTLESVFRTQFNPQGLVGKKFGEKYQILRPLKPGSRDKVFMAWDHDMGRNVAIKIFVHPPQDPLFLSEFRKNVLSTDLMHTHIVRVYEAGLQQKCLYLVMELVEGSTLQECVESWGCPSEATITNLIKKICEAVDQAHIHGVYHGKLSCEHIIVNTKTGVLKVLGFGEILAWRFGEEVNKRKDREKDIQDLGKVMHFLVAGKDPDIYQEYRKSTQTLSEANLKFDILFGRVFHPDEDERVPTPKSFGNDLSCLLEHYGLPKGYCYRGKRHSNVLPVVSYENDLVKNADDLELPNLELPLPIVNKVSSRRKRLALASSLVLVLLGASGWWFWESKHKTTQTIPVKIVEEKKPYVIPKDKLIGDYAVVAMDGNGHRLEMIEQNVRDHISKNGFSLLDSPWFDNYMLDKKNFDHIWQPGIAPSIGTDDLKNILLIRQKVTMIESKVSGRSIYRSLVSYTGRTINAKTGSVQNFFVSIEETAMNKQVAFSRASQGAFASLVAKLPSKRNKG